MFVDEVKMKLIAGKGGDGCTSFRREKYISMGGPDGGSGGKGASIIFEASEGLKTLVDLKYHKIVKAPKGENGKGKNRKGANAEDIILKVPTGTTIIDDDTGLVLADLVEDKERVVAAVGGRGGRGNVAFATHEHPAPSFSELGEPGEIRYIKCELKVLADVGLIGMPSVGKSSLLASVSMANPKIAAYHFTTLIPNLGVVELKNKKSFIIADLPGMIEGASNGVGLGDRFLKHASRTRILAHVVDMAGTEGRSPIEDYEVIRKELVFYSEKLANKKEIIVANKMDMPNFEENLKKFKEKYPDKEIFSVSALTKEGLEPLMNYLADTLETLEKENLYQDEEYESSIIYKFQNEKPYTITKEDGIWVIRGEEIEKLFSMTRFSEDEAVQRFARKLKGMGVEDALERLGAKKGDEVQILDYIFEFKD
ncbi:TPA: GTPase ObgE [Candidatus Ventrenecus avicola]|nr:GTPase ObgE [Candidatus Ventrenecus avicola]